MTESLGGSRATGDRYGPGADVPRFRPRDFSNESRTPVVARPSRRASRTAFRSNSRRNCPDDRNPRAPPASASWSRPGRSTKLHGVGAAPCGPRGHPYDADSSHGGACRHPFVGGTRGGVQLQVSTTGRTGVGAADPSTRAATPEFIDESNEFVEYLDFRVDLGIGSRRRRDRR